MRPTSPTRRRRQIHPGGGEAAENSEFHSSKAARRGCRHLADSRPDVNLPGWIKVDSDSSNERPHRQSGRPEPPGRRLGLWGHHIRELGQPGSPRRTRTMANIRHACGGGLHGWPAFPPMIRHALLRTARVLIVAIALAAAAAPLALAQEVVTPNPNLKLEGIPPEKASHRQGSQAGRQDVVRSGIW